MKRDLTALSDTEFDLVIIGGGIYGAAATWDAALRGLNVALIERNDFGGATSSNSLKIIHGGLRYIQQADVKRMRESIRERRILMTIAPHLVHPMPCVMPLYGHLGKGPEVMRIAMLINDLVGFDRNRIDDPQKILPNGGVISRQECLQILPGVKEDNLTGGALWYDCHVHSSERLLISYLRSAAEAGAQAANYIGAEKMLLKDNHVIGVEAKDRLTGERFRIRSKLVLNTSGPWVNETMNMIRNGTGEEEVKLSWAMNMVTRKLFDEYAAGVSGRIKIRENNRLVDKGSKVYFITPWREYSLVGTVHRPYSGKPDEFAIKESFIHDFIRAVNEAIPGNPLKREDVSFFYGGLLPMDRPNPKNGEVILTKHYKIKDHAQSDGIEGMISVIGVKYTTARDVGKKTVDYVLKKLGAAHKESETENKRVFGGSIDRFDEFKQKTMAEWKQRLPEAVLLQMAFNYGSEISRVLKYGEENPDYLKPISGTAVLPAEIIHAVREEMALHLTDALWRRTELGSAGNPGDTVLQSVAEFMGKELGWNKETIAAEVAAAKSIYVPAEG